MNDSELSNFARMLNTEILDRAGGGRDGEAGFKENVFTTYVQEHLEETGIVENAGLCHFEARIGRGNVKVNGFGVNDDNDTLDLYTCIFHDSVQLPQISKNEISRAANEVVRFFHASINGHHRKMETASDAYAMVSRISEISSSLAKVRIFILTDGMSRIKELKGLKIKTLPLSFEVEVWDVERLFRSMGAGIPRDAIEINFAVLSDEPVPCLSMPRPASDYTAYLVILPAEILYRIYEEYGQRVLEFNVRSFLQARGKVNKGIKDTLKDEPDRFMAYNNGISATADEVELTEMEDGRQAICSIKGFQIVNSGQTTASLHRSKKHDSADISGVFVPAKITVVTSGKLEEIVPKISLYANSQNAIQTADFSANNPFHIEIERLANAIWCPGQNGRWFYERARGQYQVVKSSQTRTRAQKRKFDETTPASRKFTKTDMAKFINSWNQKPYLVSRGAQKNFVAFMEEIQNRSGNQWSPDETWYRQLIAKAILFKQAARIVRQEKFPAYKANIVTYVIAYLSFRSPVDFNFSRIWKKQGISNELESMIRAWAHPIYDTIISTAGGKNITEWCKKEECWHAIRRIELEPPAELPPELSG